MSLPEALVIGALAALLAGFTKGVAGFGFGLVLTPLLLLVGGAEQAVFTSVAIGVPLSLAVVWQARRELPRRELLPLLLPAVLATPLGILLLGSLPASTARTAAALLALGGALLMLRGRGAAPGARGLGVLAAAGAVGGFVNGLAGMGGPPVALLIAARGSRLQEGRGLLAAFNLASYIIAAAGLLIGGAVGTAALRETALLLPFAALGTWLGTWVSHRAPAGAYRSVAPLAAAGASLIALLGALRP